MNPKLKTPRIFFRLLFPLCFLLLLSLSLQLQSQIVHVTPGGAGLMDGSSWANALDGNGAAGNGYTKLADVMKTATPGKQFWLAEGTYLAATDNDRNKSFEIVQNVSVYGGFGSNDTTFGQRNYSLHETILSGNIGNPTDSTDNTKIILKTVTAPWTLYSNLDGLTILNSFNNQANTISPGLVNYAMLNVSHCTFKNNYSNGSGGGIYNSGKINIRNCLFFNNRASSGAGVYNEYLSGPTSTAYLFATSCRFSNNSAGNNGGAICNSGAGTISNCLVVNNVAGLNGGGIYSGGNVNMTYINTKIINSTIASNSGNVHFYRGAAVLWNSISWGGSIYISSYTNPDIKFSSIQGSISGTGVINSDPLFNNPTLVAGTSVNGLTGDWHIRWCSPCFNAASNLLVLSSDTTDLDGLQRIRYSSVDMGCYELDTTSLYQNSINYSGGVVYVDTGSIFKGNGSSWIQALGGKVESCKYSGRSMLYEAMADAPPGTEIWVSAGTYLASTWNIRDHAFTVAPGVKVFGGFSGTETSTAQRNTLINITVFSGNTGNPALNTDNSYHVLNINPGGIAYADSALLDGIIIEKGYANGSSALSEGGGMLVNSNTRLRCNDLRVGDNTSKGNGSGIKINNNAKVSLTNSRIETNHLILSYNGSYYYSASGCGIYNLGKLSLSGCHVTHNNDGKEGSGIYNADSLVLMGCSIDSNTATFVRDSYGVGLSNAGYCKSTNTSIRFNKANIYGGGIQNKAGATMILDSNIVSYNFTLATNNSKGGGIYNSGILTLNNCDIQYNSAIFDGGGLYNSVAAHCTVLGTTFANNIASGGTVTVGGGGVCNFGFLGVNRSKICNNQTSGSGGGVYNPTIVNNSLIANNAKGGQFTTGGGLRIAEGCQGIFNSTITNNIGQGIAATYINGSNLHEEPVNDTTSIANSIIFGNDVPLSGYFSASNACIENGYQGVNILRDPPLFTTPTNGKGISFNALSANWAPGGCSPCINSGNNGFISATDTLDIAGHPRVFESTIDLGAYEYQQNQPHSIDFSAGVVMVCDATVEAGKGTTWSDVLSGNAPSCRYPGYNLLYEAMRDVPPDCPLWIKHGTYYTSTDNDRNKPFLLKPGLQVFGGFAGNEQLLSQRNLEMNPTILSGNVGNPADSTDNAFHVLYSYPADSIFVDTILLDGLTISSGYANYQCQYYCLHDDLVGGGLFLNSNHFLKMDHCIVIDNYGIGNFSTNPATIGKMGGGGIYNKGSLWLRNCIVKKNTNLRMGGGIFNDHFLDLFQCKIDSNTISQSSGSGYSAWGGAGVYNTLNGALVFDSCSFTGNRLINTQLSGGGIWNRGQMNAVINSTFCFNTNSGVATENPTSVSNCSFISNENGITASQSLDIEDCLVTHNGVGISTGGTSVIHDCEIASNSYGITTTGNAHIYDCQIHHNDNGGFTEYCPGGWFCYVIIKYLNIGSGIKHQGDSLIVERCTINNNIGGGGSGVCVLSGNALIRSCTIYRNKGDAGAAIKNYASTVLDNCLVTNNTSHQYGVFNNIGNSITTIKNTTIANNSVFTDFDGKIFCHGAHYNTTGTSFFNLVNCIVQSVYSPLFKYYTGNFGSDSISYSHTSNGFVGIGNIAGDPLFISSIPENDTLLIPSPAHYSLSACSPCINAGSDSLTTDSLDLAGSIRKYNTVDMGALELKYDSSVTALWSSNITETDAVIHWSRSVKPCETVVFINDTTTGSPDPLAGAFYQANAVFGQGSNLNGWYCLYKGMDSTVNVSGLVGGTTYRVAVFNLILDSIYDVPALMNFTTPGILPVNKYVISDTIGNGEWACYNASNSIVVAGNGASYKINSGGSVNLIAGQTIRLLPGTTVEQGGYLLAEIRPNGPWCYETKSVATADMEPGPPGTDSGENFRVKVWPNPVSGLLNVAWSGLNKTDPVMVELRNLYGSEIFMTDVSGSSNIVLSLKNLPRGMYFLRVIQGEQSVLSKIVRN